MKVKVSNVMKRYLSENIPEYKFYLLEMSVDYYDNVVSTEAYENGADYNPDKDLMRVLQVVYPAEYYAMPRYITTKELNRIYRRCDGSAAGFIQAVKEEIEI